MGLAGKVKRYLKRISLKKEKVDNPVLYGSLLEGRNALITGGTSGIGLAMAKAFVRNGAAVVITSRFQSRVDAAVKQVEQSTDGGGCVSESSSIAQ